MTHRRFVTFTTYDNEDPQAMTEAEFNVARFATDVDWADYVWQFAESKEQAIAQHDAKLDEYQADINAGRAEKRTY